MSTLISNLYPPIVPDTCPAFIKNGPCRIYFSLSPYNSISEIDTVHISVVNQKTNASALDPKKYPAGIKIAYPILDSQKEGDYTYYIDIIPVNDIIGGEFELNQFYKIQLRFALPIEIRENNQILEKEKTAEWLYQNKDSFSEWSRVCLIKGISAPKIFLHGFDDADSLEETVLPSSLIEIVGHLNFEDRQEKECLRNYNIKIYQEEDINNLLFDSGNLYPNIYNPNEFNYSLPYHLINGTYYVMTFTYTTSNLYTESIEYRFVIIEYGQSQSLDATITATPDNDNGRIIIHLLSNTEDIFLGNFSIRRTSSKSDFHIWEDIKTVAYTNGTKLDYTLYDNTVENGVWYKYCAQRRNAIGTRGPIIQINQPVMCLLDDMFLTRNNRQLKIQFNPTIGDFKYNVAESQQTAIGAKYPYIKRNGNNYFRTFSIGGLISSFVDTTNWYDPHYYENDGGFNNNKNEIKSFTSKEQIYGQYQTLYRNFNYANNIDDYNDYIYEKRFRDIVYDFLYKNDVKLFRSATEGNILVKLMNISFQPVENLGRRLYSFTATAVEVDEANIDNYNKYEIINIGTYEQHITFEHQIQGFLQLTTSDNKHVDVLKQINSQFKRQAITGFENNIRYLTQLKLEINSQPYVIIEGSDGQLKKATKDDVFDPAKATSGYLVSINGIKMIIYPRMERYLQTDETSNNIYKEEIRHIGIFELKENNTCITELSFQNKTNVTINYTALLAQSEDLSHLTKHYYYYYKPGQLYGTFEPTESLMRKIYNKYLLKYDSYYQKIIDVTEIKVEGPPGAIIYVKDSKDDDFNKHILANGFLQLKDDQTLIEGLYFGGRHLLECKDPLQVSTVNGVPLVPQQGIYNSIAEIEAAAAQVLQDGEPGKPVNGGIYQIRGYGIKQAISSFENNEILVIDLENEDPSLSDEDKRLIIETIEDYYARDPETPSDESGYRLLIDQIDDDDSLKFVYYYGSWYVLSKALERAEHLIKTDIRHVRDEEFILTGQTYQDITQIKNPIRNGVYHISPIVVEDENAEFSEDHENTLDVSENGVIQEADENYSLKMKRLFEDVLENNYIYYHGNWYPFTTTHDVICPIEGIVDYYVEIVKGVY